VTERVATLVRRDRVRNEKVKVLEAIASPSIANVPLCVADALLDGGRRWRPL